MDEQATKKETTDLSKQMTVQLFKRQMKRHDPYLFGDTALKNVFNKMFGEDNG